MRALRNMKLVRKEQKSFAVNIVVDFDRTKHLSDASVKRRKIMRDRCIGREQARDEEEKKKRAAELDKKEQERFGNVLYSGGGISFLMVYLIMDPNYCLNFCEYILFCILRVQHIYDLFTCNAIFELD